MLLIIISNTIKKSGNMGKKKTKQTFKLRHNTVLRPNKLVLLNKVLRFTLNMRRYFCSFEMAKLKSSFKNLLLKYPENILYLYICFPSLHFYISFIMFHCIMYFYKNSST